LRISEHCVGIIWLLLQVHFYSSWENLGAYQYVLASRRRLLFQVCMYVCHASGDGNVQKTGMVAQFNIDYSVAIC